MEIKNIAAELQQIHIRAEASSRKSPDGKNAVIAYFIMGRSVNSRNRDF